MPNSRTSAIIVGILYIIGTVSGVASVLLTGSILSEPNMLAKVAARETQVVWGAVMVLTMGLALSLVPVVAYPVLAPKNPVLAIGYVVFRGALEAFVDLIYVIGALAMIPLARLAAGAAATSAEAFEAMAMLLLGEVTSAVLTVVFIIGAVMFYWALYRYRLVPRWLSGWGLLSAIPYLIAGFMVMFGVIEHMSTWDTLPRMPLALQEMVLAVWLIAVGWNREALESTAS